MAEQPASVSAVVGKQTSNCARTNSCLACGSMQSNDRVTAAVAVRQTVDNTRNASAALTLQHAI